MIKPLDIKLAQQAHLRTLIPFVEACVKYINDQIIRVIKRTPARKLKCFLSHMTVPELKEVLDIREIDNDTFLQEISPLVAAKFEAAGYKTQFKVVADLIEVTISLQD